MAEANDINYGKIGFTLIMGIACTIGALVWFGGMGTGKNLIAGETYFNSPVSGLSIGSDVCFRGVKVGSVTRISFIGNEYREASPEHGRIIWVGFSIDPRLCGYKEDSGFIQQRIDYILAKGIHATLSANILTGMAHIELNYPKMPIKDEPISWKPRSPCVPPAPTLLESASDVMPKLIAKIEEIDFSGGWSNAVDAISSAGMFMGSANSLLETQQGNIAEVIGNLRDASAALRDFSYQVRDNPSLLLRSSDQPPLPETSH